MAHPGSNYGSASTGSQAAAGFEYHANIVRFMGDGFTSGTFKVDDKEQSISEGQDPNDINTFGLVHKIYSYDGSFVFVAGRSATTAVAAWWEARIPAEKNTFNDTPKNLNFAFMGQLKLQFNGGLTLTFEKIGLAQGHHKTFENNWWFGGQHCKNVGDKANPKMVQCNGTDQSGKTHQVNFISGTSRSDDNVVYVELQ